MATDRHRPKLYPPNRSSRNHWPLPKSLLLCSFLCRDGGNWRMELFHNGAEFFFNFFDFYVQFPDQSKDMLQFQRLGRYNRANRTSGCIPEFYCHNPPVTTFGSVVQERFQVCQMSFCNLLRAGKFAITRGSQIIVANSSQGYISNYTGSCTGRKVLIVQGEWK